MAGENCSIHLSDSITTEAEALAFAKKLSKLGAQSDADLAAMQAQTELILRQDLDASLRFRERRVRDSILIETGIRKAQVTYKLDADGNQQRVVLNSLSAIRKNQLNQLVGRGGLDTQHRTMRRHLEKFHEQAENGVQVDGNSKIRRRADIAKGSAEEREFFKAVRTMERIDPDTVTPEQLTSLMTGKSNVQKLAVIQKLSNEYTRKVVNRHGGDIRYSENYVVGRVYEWGIVEKMGSDGFADFLVTKLNLEKTFGVGTDEHSAKQKLKEIFREMRGNASQRADEASQFLGGGTRGDSQMRAFVFKDIDAEYDSLNQFSSRSINEMALADARSAASTAVKIKNFGYDSKRVLGAINEALVRDYGTGSTPWKDTFTNARIIQAQLELSGQQSHVNTGLTTWANAARMANAVTMLGNALSTTALDMIENNRQAFYMNGRMFGGIAEYADSMRKLISPQALGGWSKEEIKQLADMVGVVFNYQTNAEGLRLASGELSSTGSKPHDWLMRKANTIMNWSTLLPAQTGYSNIASRVAQLQEFNILLDAAKNKNLTAWQKDFFYEYKINQGELNALTSGAIKGLDTIGGSFINGKAVRDSLLAQPERAAKLLGVDIDQAAQAVMDLAEKLDMVVDDAGVRGTPQPELMTKTLIGKTSPSERVRVASGILFQFLDTPIAQTQYFAELVEKAQRVKGSNLGALQAITPHAMIYTGMAIPTLLAADAVMSTLLGRESLLDRYTNGDEKQRGYVMSTLLSKTMFVPFAAELIENQFGGGYDKDITDTFSSPTVKRISDTSKLLNPNNSSMTMERYGKRYTPNSIPVQLMKNWGGALMENME